MDEMHATLGARAAPLHPTEGALRNGVSSYRVKNTLSFTALDDFAQRAGEVVAGHVADAEARAAEADRGQARADVLTHACDIAFHVPGSFVVWKSWMVDRGRPSPPGRSDLSAGAARP